MTDVLQAKSFTTTRWSVVERARLIESAESSQAREYLCAASWYPIYAYIRRQGNNESDSYDLTQAFFEHFFAKHLIDKVDSGRGRFRTFLLGAVRNFILDERKRETRQKRGAGEIHFSIDAVDAENRYLHEPNHQESPDRLFERRWAKDLVMRVLARLRSEYVKGQQVERFDRLKECLFEADGKYAEYASQLNLSESAFGAALSRMRSRYRELFRLEVADFILDSGDIEDEMRHIFQVLRQAA